MGGSAHMGMTLAALYFGTAGQAYKTGCNASMAAGALSGAGMVASVGLIQNQQDFAGHAVGSAVTAVTGFFMARRWLSLRHPFMPNGALACISFIGCIYNTYKANEWADSW
eukprot:TRINITY_DN33504_c0_g1_i1.p1 TRINITY_DN33504_c0_g1~~TRINITY_DN33504_c0_g1_i1.p1  ORF type:complete len:127 (+),score=15.17 TRINITY_DN33504_c0_g1_i1:51-383(+)